MKNQGNNAAEFRSSLGTKALKGGSGRVLVNISNHPSAAWPEVQLDAAKKLADQVMDLPFPAVPPQADEAEVARIGHEVLSRVPSYASHAMVMGEYTLSFLLVHALASRGIRCFAATTERIAVETAPGVQTSRFGFVRFREYDKGSVLSVK